MTYNPDYKVPLFWLIKEKMEYEKLGIINFYWQTGIPIKKCADILNGKSHDYSDKELRDIADFIKLDYETVKNIHEEYKNGVRTTNN